MTLSLLIVEDDAAFAALLRGVARDCGFEAEVCADGESGLRALRDDPPDALVTDMRLPGADGLALIRRARELDAQRPLLLVTGYATAGNAIEAFRLGVSDVLLKPVELDDARAALLRLRDHVERARRITQLTEQVRRARGDALLVSQSPAMRVCLDLAARVADASVPVLLEGETGVGKGILARHIHDLSPRAAGAWFTLNCAALAPTLLESELFGHEKGAFSGATARKPGLLEMAAGGTLFLDEIHAASPEAQTRLLQFIQDKTLLRVGGTRPLSVDVRLVCAANRPLAGEVAAGRFREDLYYRIKVFPITVPPLRARREDIPTLAAHLVARHAREIAHPGMSLDDEALRRLCTYAWPGNVRELENVLQRAIVLARGTRIGAAELPSELDADAARAPACPWSEEATLAEVEHAWIRHVLERCGGNRARAARMLGIDPSTLWRKLRDGAALKGSTAD